MFLDMEVPELPAGAGHVWWASPAVARPELLALLDDTERARWSAFKPAADRARYLVAHALLRLVLATYLETAPERISLTAVCQRCGAAHGKPRVRTPAADLELSVSHAGERVAVAVARGVPVGVDVEPVEHGRHVTEVAGLALSAAEQDAFWRLAAPWRPAALMGYWTRKEALLKATGDGLAVEPGSLTVTAPDQPPALVAWTAHPPLTAPAHLTELRPGSGHVGCLAALGAPLTVTEYDARGLRLGQRRDARRPR